MVGQVLGAVGHLPNIYTELEVSYYLLRRLLGVRTEGRFILYFIFGKKGTICSVGDPKPADPHVFDPSGSISQRHGSGSFTFLGRTEIMLSVAAGGVLRC
jgi:hypothetical protein